MLLSLMTLISPVWRRHYKLVLLHFCSWPKTSARTIGLRYATTMFAQTLYTQRPCTITPVVLPNKFEDHVKIPMGLKCIKQFRLDFEDELVKKSVTRIFNVKVREWISSMNLALWLTHWNNIKMAARWALLISRKWIKG